MDSEAFAMSYSFPIRAALAAALTTTFCLFPCTTHAANNAEQVVFSGTGVPPVSSEPIGFWVWCQVEPASEHSHYDTDCNGALYFYARGITVHVTGEVSEPEEGVYVMDLEAPRSALQCELSNEVPFTHGPNNTVLGECNIDGTVVSGLMSTSAVVVVTGPE